jgi:hypothetical protein
MVPAISRLCAAVFVAGIVLAGARTAYPFEITQSIPNSDVTACLDVKGQSTSTGAAIETYPCDAGFNEQWALIGGASYVFFEVYNTSGNAARCLSAQSTTPSAGVILSDCGTSATSWLLDGTIVDSSAGGLLCLDSQGNYGSGAQAVVNNCSAATSQIWELKNIVIAQPIPGTNNNACANVRNKSISNGTPVDAYPCTMGINTLFTYINYQLQGVVTNNVSTCLGETTSGTIELQTCNGSLTQAWTVGGSGVKGGVIIINENSQNCLDSQGNYGSTAQLADTPNCQTGAPAVSQLWTLH